MDESLIQRPAYDPDVLTGAVVFNKRFDGASGGSSRQSGEGSPGSGGFRPILTAWIQDVFVVLPFTLGGPGGTPGKGAVDIPYGPIPPELGGVTMFLQVAIADPGTPNLLSATNGVEVRHGN